MKHDFDRIIDRRNTYSTQWDYIEDRFGKKALLPFSISDSDFEVPEVVIDNLQKCLQHRIFGYTRWNHDDYKHAIIRHYKQRFHTTIDSNWIVYSPSVMYSVALLIRILSKKGDSIFVFDPMYDAFINVIEKNDRILHACALDKDHAFTIDWIAFEEGIKICKIFLLCSPHNPTGRVFTQIEMEKMIALCKKYNVYIISDEIHSDVVLKGNTHLPIIKFLSQYENIILVSSASKTFNTPALGGSFAILANVDIYQKFLIQTRQRDFLNSANVMGMVATMSAYNKASYYIDQLVFYIEENMKLVESFIHEHFQDITFVCPQATYLAWIDMRKIPFDDEAIQKALIDIGEVAIMCGKVYGKNGEKFLRLNVGCPRAKLLEGLHRFKKAIDALYEEKLC